MAGGLYVGPDSHPTYSRQNHVHHNEIAEAVLNKQGRDISDEAIYEAQADNARLMKLLGISNEIKELTIEDLYDDFTPITFRANYGWTTIKGVRLPRGLSSEEQDFLGDDQTRSFEQVQAEGLSAVAVVEINPQELKKVLTL